MMKNRAFLYAGLSILAITFVVKWTVDSAILFYILFGIAILLKVTFLINIFRTKGFQPNLGFYMILIGIAMMLTSLLFKKIIPASALQKLLFIGAIALKISGLILMIIDSRKTKNHSL